jgi:peroxidase
LPSYNTFRSSATCGGTDLSGASWSTVPPNIDPTGWNQASRVYQTPADIDLFVGGLIEIPVPGGLTGPTFNCIKAVQFNRLKYGDRYFFTHDLATGFTPNQLTNLVSQRLSDIICRNSAQPDAQANVFLVPSSR